MNTTHHTNRRAEFYRRKADTSWGRGFLVGLIVGVALAAAWFSPVAHGKNLTAPPPHLSTWLAIAKCEQPKPGGWGKWGSVNWTHDGPGVTFPGGGGMQTILWELHRRPHMRHVKRMSAASPLEQTWAMYRFWKWAERTYPGAGYTGWECSRDIGWTTSNPADAVR